MIKSFAIMLSKEEVDSVVLRMKQLSVNPCPLPVDPTKHRFWLEHLSSVDTADAIVYGHYTEPLLYSKVHSLFVSCKLAIKLAVKSGVNLDELVKEYWYESPYRRVMRSRKSYGELMEPRAITLYSRMTGKIVKLCKHVVNPKVPFLICSPDGLTFKNNKICSAIEVKTIPDIDSRNELHKLRCCEMTRGRLSLRESVPVYAQMQFTMLTLNLDSMDLVLYFPNFHHVEVVVVSRNPTFLNTYLPKAYKNYVDKVIPHIIERIAKI
jgi:hypothetical protein